MAEKKSTKPKLLFFVMAGLDPAIHVFSVVACQRVDARVKPGHDER